MSIKKNVLTISNISLIAIVLFIYPSINQPVRAEKVNFDGYKNQNISLRETIGSIKVYTRIAASDAIIEQRFGKNIVDKILAQPGCDGVRMYYGKHENGKSGVLLLGVDKYGKDIVTGVIAGPIAICPSYCGQ